MAPSRLFHHLSIPAGGLCLLLLTACSGGVDGGANPTVTAGNAAPTVIVPARLQATAPQLAVDVDASDPDGDPLGFAWSLQSGPATAVRFDDPTLEDPTIDFPLNGSYVLRVRVDDGTDTVSRDVTVDVAVSGARDIVGSVADGGAPTPGLVVTLEWLHLAGGPAVRNSTTDSAGAYRFDDIVGPLSDYTVTVPGSP